MLDTNHTIRAAQAVKRVDPVVTGEEKAGSEGEG